MPVLITGNEIVLSGTVGDLFWGDSFSSTDVRLALAEVGPGQDVIVRLNSGGGIATEGAAIHSVLSAHKGNVTIVVEGIAASAASIIAMAGDDIVMSLGATMMVHDPSGLTFGTAADHEIQLRTLNTIGGAMAGIYAEQTGKSVDECRADMQSELWMTPEQAVEAGYADRVGMIAANDDGTQVVAPSDDPDDEAPDVEPTAFNYRLFKHPPERLVALADKHGWASRSRAATASAVSSRQPNGDPMANQNRADGNVAPDKTQADVDAARQDGATAATASERTRISAIMTSEEAKGREELAQHFAYETDMAPEAAKAALGKAPKPAAPTAKQSPFEARMNATPNPNVGADGGPVDQEDPAAVAAAIVAAHRGRTVQKRSA